MKEIFDHLLNFIFPLRCIKCQGNISSDSIFCYKCWYSIEFLSEPSCYICSNPFQYSFDIPKHLQICAPCHKNKPLFDKLVSVFKYTDDIKKIIFHFKYNDRLHLAKPFGYLISKKLLSNDLEIKPDFIIPVPLHSKKLRQRMYNQSALLAKHVASNNNLHFIHNLLIRKKYNQSQTNYTRKMRASNVRGAFVINNKYHHLIENKNILLIDNVITTGATIHAVEDRTPRL